jgi:hypothetical protein
MTAFVFVRAPRAIDLAHENAAGGEIDPHELPS